jgi:protein O-mannosyl-transferase
MNKTKFLSEIKWWLPLVLVAIVVFANTLSGEFVYDDNRQILRNSLIQDNSLIGKALTSDVWAFKGDGTIAASNYWRPTFTAWNIICFRLFGTNPFGWHLLNILLHAGICLLAFLFLRKLDLPPIVAFAICLIFAVHPVHVESVAWIAGSPDLLFTLAFLGSLWFAHSYAKSSKLSAIVLSVLFYAIALGAKEIGILCLPVYWLIFSKFSDNPKSKNSTLLVYLGIAIVYFIARIGVIGAISLPPQDAASFGSALLTVPSIFVFYLQQTVFPLWLSANYSLRPIETIGLLNFIVPIIISIIVLIGLFYLAKRSKLGLIGIAFFILPLIPAMNSTAFIREQIVHDRYLYLPILGILLILFPILHEGLEKFRKEAILLASIAISLPLAVQTYAYNRSWLNDLAIWENASKVDTNSSFTFSQYGSELSESGKISDAIAAYTKSLGIKETQRGLYGRGRNYTAQKKYTEAEKDLLKALQMPIESTEAYASYQIYESLAIVYSEQLRYAEAEKILVDGRKKLPIYYAALTEKLAVVYYHQDKKSEALAELEAAKAQARRELLPESKMVFLRIGMLNNELGKKDEARKYLQEFLNLTASLKDKNTEQGRQQALNLLKKL